jgi:hypothetical protein
MEVSGQLYALVALPTGKRPPVTHWVEGRVGPRAGMDANKLIKFSKLKLRLFK